MRGSRAKKLRKIAAAKFPKGSQLHRNEDGVIFTIGFRAYYQKLKNEWTRFGKIISV